MPYLGKFKSNNSRYSAILSDYLRLSKHKACLQPCLQPRAEVRGPSAEGYYGRCSFSFDLGYRVKLDKKIMQTHFSEQNLHHFG
jgi:hypothetical protein